MSAAEWTLCRRYLAAHPGEGAAVLEATPAEAAAALLAMLPTATAGRIVELLTVTSAVAFVERLPADSAAAILETTSPSAAARLLRALAPERRASILEAMDAAVVASVEPVLRYPEWTAGGLMDPRVLAVPDDVVVGEARRRVRADPRWVRYYLYVVTRGGVLVGVVSLRSLFLSARGAPIVEVAERAVEALRAGEDKAALLAHPGWERFPVLPVVDDGRHLVGVLRYETLRWLEREERSRRAGADEPIRLLVDLGELCWSGVARGLDELWQGLVATSEKGEER